jgi:hypothetical protein
MSGNWQKQKSLLTFKIQYSGYGETGYGINAKKAAKPLQTGGNE